MRAPAHAFLFEQMVRRELRQKYKGSSLGVAWYVIHPLVLMGAYYLLFGLFLRVFDREDYPLFLLVGLVVWIFFSQSVMAAAPSLLEQGALIRKAVFPRETIPASVVTVQAVTFAIVFALVAAVTLALRGTLDPALLLLPVVLVALYAFTLGVALAVSVLHAYFRDVAPILAAVLLPWFFLSPIFYEVDDVVGRDGYRFVLEWLNPVAPFITAVRDILYEGTFPGGAVLLYVVGIAAVALAGGVAIFRSLQRELAVVV